MSTLRNAVAIPNPDPGKPATNVFTTPQSIVTFSGATGAAITVANVIHAFLEGVAWEGIAAGSAMFIGLIIFGVGFDSTLGRRDQLVAFGIAVINTFVIAAAVLGLQVAA